LCDRDNYDNMKTYFSNVMEGSMGLSKLPPGFKSVEGAIVWAPRQPLWYRVLWRLFHPLEALRDYAYEVQRRSGGLFGDNDD